MLTASIQKNVQQHMEEPSGKATWSTNQKSKILKLLMKWEDGWEMLRTDVNMISFVRAERSECCSFEDGES